MALFPASIPPLSHAFSYPLITQLNLQTTVSSQNVPERLSHVFSAISLHLANNHPHLLTNPFPNPSFHPSILYLFLFSNLHNHPLISNHQLHGDEFPISSIPPSNPIQSIASNYPSKASFWRSTAKLWLNLIYISHNSAENSQNNCSHVGSDNHSHNHDLLEINLDWLDILDVFFVGIEPKEHSLKSQINSIFINHISSHLLPPPRNPVAQNDPFVVISPRDMIKQLASTYNSHQQSTHPASNETANSQNKDSILVPINILNNWLIWAIIDPPNIFSSIKVSKSGIAYALSQPLLNIPNQLNILMQKKKDVFVLILPHIANNAHITIHRYHHSTVYILGHPRSITINKSKNTKIFSGPVASILAISNSKNITVSAVCGQFILSSSPPDPILTSTPSPSDGIITYINSNYPPIITESSLSISESSPTIYMDQKAEIVAKGLVIAPCNMYYNGMLADIKAAGLNIDTNMYDKYVIVSDPFNPSSLDANLDTNTSSQSTDNDVAMAIPNSTSSEPELFVSKPQDDNLADQSKNKSHLVTLLPPNMYFIIPFPFDPVHLDAHLSAQYVQHTKPPTSPSFKPSIDAPPTIDRTQTVSSLISIASISSQMDDTMDTDDEHHIHTTTSSSNSSGTSYINDSNRNDSSNTLLDFSMDDWTSDLHHTKPSDTSTQDASTNTPSMTKSCLTDMVSLDTPSPDHASLISSLPSTYQSRIASITRILSQTQSELQSMTTPSDTFNHLQSTIEHEFQGWLRNTGRVHQLANVVDILRDLKNMVNGGTAYDHDHGADANNLDMVSYTTSTPIVTDDEDTESHSEYTHTLVDVKTISV